MKTADYIVVLSADIRPDGSVGHITHERTLAGIDLYKRGYAPKLVLSGGIVGRIKTDHAGAMAEIALAEGVPERDLILEDQAKSTLQNALFTADHIDRKSKAIIVTSPFHTARSLLAFRVMGYADIQMFSSPANRSYWVRFKATVREVPAFWFNLVRFPVWKILNLFDRQKSTDWILA